MSTARENVVTQASAVPGTRYTIRSEESEVRFLQDKQLYHKIKNPFAKIHVKTNTCS